MSPLLQKRKQAREGPRSLRITLQPADSLPSALCQPGAQQPWTHCAHPEPLMGSSRVTTESPHLGGGRQVTSGTAPHTAFPAFEPRRPQRAWDLVPLLARRWPLRALPGVGHGPTPPSGTACAHRAGERVCAACQPPCVRAVGGALVRAEGRQREGGGGHRHSPCPAGDPPPPPGEHADLRRQRVHLGGAGADPRGAPALHRRGAGVLPAVVGPVRLEDPEAPGDGGAGQGWAAPGLAQGC